MKSAAVLCLHGYSQDGATLRSHLRRLTERVGGRASFHFHNAPFPVPSVVDPSKQGFSWWHANRDQNGEWTYDGVDSTLQAVAEMNEMEKRRAGVGFAGVLGFSQGGALASLLVGLNENQELPSPLPDLRFAMFAGAFRYRAVSPCYDHLFGSTSTQSLVTPSLHCIGARDRIVRSVKSEELADCFSEQTRVYCRHNGGHVVPASRSALDLFDEFLFAQQRASLRALAQEFGNGSYC